MFETFLWCLWVCLIVNVIRTLWENRKKKSGDKEEKNEEKNDKLPPDRKMVTYQVDKETENAFRTICNENGTTTSEQIRKMMAAYVEEAKKKEDREKEG